MSLDLSTLVPDQVLDGGDLDCGSGLVLLIREHMMGVRPGGVLEMRSSEPTVADDLPPWCRMAGHEFLGSLPGAGQGSRVSRHFVRRGMGAAAGGQSPNAAQSEEQVLAEDKARARAYEWRLRTRSSGTLKSTVYCRNFSFDVGQSASFEEKDRHPSAVEYLLGALSADLCTAYATNCARAGLTMDDVEITARGRLGNVLAHLGLEEGDPSFAAIEIKCFASTLDDEDTARAVWERTVAASPLAATLAKALELTLKFAVV